MNDINVSSVLAQIRALSAQAQNAPRAPAAPSADSAQTVRGGGFGSLVKEAIGNVGAQQQQAGQLQNRFEVGDPSVDLSSVMLASSKAQVSFRAMVEVRNRLVNAYQEVMNMPL